MAFADWLPLLFIVLVITTGAAAQAAIGMGLNLLAIPLLVLVDPRYAPGPVFVASMILAILALWRVPATVDRGELRLSLAGLVIGTILAGGVLLVLNATLLTRLLGLLVVFAVVLALTGWSARLTPANLLFAGGSAGLLGTIAGVHAPPIALLYQGGDPVRVRGALLTYIAIGNGLSLLALVLVGRFGIDQAKATLVLLPGVALGLMAAPYVARLFDARRLRFAILGVSALSGLALVLRG